MIIFDRSGPAQTSGILSARKSCLSRNFPAASGLRGHGPGPYNYPSHSLPERTGLRPFCIPASSGSIPLRRAQTVQGTRLRRGISSEGTKFGHCLRFFCPAAGSPSSATPGDVAGAAPGRSTAKPGPLSGPGASDRQYGEPLRVYAPIRRFGSAIPHLSGPRL
jgi:hypothetical protein